MKTVYKVVIKAKGSSTYYSAWLFDTALSHGYSTEYFTYAMRGKLFAFLDRKSALNFATAIARLLRVEDCGTVHIFKAIGKQVTQPKELWINSYTKFLRYSLWMFWDGLEKYSTRKFSHRMRSLFPQKASKAPSGTVLCSAIKLVKEVI